MSSCLLLRTDPTSLPGVFLPSRALRQNDAEGDARQLGALGHQWGSAIAGRRRDRRRGRAVESDQPSATPANCCPHRAWHPGRAQNSPAPPRVSQHSAPPRGTRVISPPFSHDTCCSSPWCLPSQTKVSNSATSLRCCRLWSSTPPILVNHRLLPTSACRRQHPWHPLISRFIFARCP